MSEHIDISHLSSLVHEALKHFFADFHAERAKVINHTIWEIELSDGEVFRGRNVWEPGRIRWINKNGRDATYRQGKVLSITVCQIRDQELLDFDYDDVWKVEESACPPIAY